MVFVIRKVHKMNFNVAKINRKNVLGLKVFKGYTNGARKRSKNIGFGDSVNFGYI